MLDVGSAFDLSDDRVWLNAAHQGPLPRTAARRIEEMVMWKLRPHHLQTARTFSELPEMLRSAVAELISADGTEIVLTNGASYGLHLIANGLGLGPGDEAIVAANDFPSDILPWQRLESHGAKVVSLRPRGEVLTPDEVARAINTSTRVLCLTWVHSFSGQVIDLDAIGEVCRSARVWFVVNGSQGVGAIPISVRRHPIDALVTVGFKWLCGPYSTGFCWLRPALDDALEPQQLYWLNALTTDDLERDDLDPASLDIGRRGRHDVFSTANFLNFAGFLEAVDLVSRVGVEEIANHNQHLVDHLVDLLGQRSFDVMNRGAGPALSSILFLRPKTEPIGEVYSRLERERIDASIRRGMIRLSPHFYNTVDDVERAADRLTG